MFPSFDQVPYVVDVLWGPGTVSLVTCSGCFRSIPCLGCVYSPFIVEPQLLFVHKLVGLTLTLIGCGFGHIHNLQAAMQEAYHNVWDSGAY